MSFRLYFADKKQHSAISHSAFSQKRSEQRTIGPSRHLQFAGSARSPDHGSTDLRNSVLLHKAAPLPFPKRTTLVSVQSAGGEHDAETDLVFTGLGRSRG